MTQDMQHDDKTRRIRDLNDELRKNPFSSTLGRVLITSAVNLFLLHDADIRPTDLTARKLLLLRTAAALKDFTPDNDPYGEHDWGQFTLWERRFFFKIDYYDPSFTVGSANPADPVKTRRVMTIGFLEDW